LHFYEAAICSDHVRASFNQCLVWEQVIVPGRCTAIRHVSGAYRSETTCRKYSHKVLNIASVKSQVIVGLHPVIINLALGVILVSLYQADGEDGACDFLDEDL
jgi:hypothetical protein